MKKVTMSQATETQNKDNGLITISPSIGSGRAETIALNYGIQLMISQYCLNQPTTLVCEDPGTSFGLGFCLSGNIESYSPCHKERFLIKKGQSAFYSFQDTVGYTETTGPEQVIRISIHMDLNQMSAFITEDTDQLMNILIKAHESSLRFPDTISHPMHTVLCEILHCPYHGLTRKFFIEGKAMELLAYKMAQMETEYRQNTTESNLSPNDTDCVRYAAQLLIQNLEHTPSLTKLARSVGMCRSKLHHCFRAFYGMTPFEYLRNHRLETAERLLNEGKINVTETACKVGYASLSHFSKVFKQYFGYPPGKYLKNCDSNPQDLDNI